MAKDKFENLEQLKDAFLLGLEYTVSYKGKEYFFEGLGDYSSKEKKIRFSIYPMEPEGFGFFCYCFDDFVNKFKDVYDVTLEDFIKEAEIEDGSTDIEEIPFLKEEEARKKAEIEYFKKNPVR